MSDPLSQVLQDFRFSGVSYGQCALEPPWGIAFPPEFTARLHLVVAGDAWLRIRDDEWVHLEAGDVALLPRGPGHALCDRAHGRTKPLSAFALTQVGDRVFHLDAAVGEPRTLMACCSVGYDAPALALLVELMPELIVVRRAGVADPVLPGLLEAMAGEVRERRAGAATVLARLADVVIARIIRSWADQAKDEVTGWLAAVRDPRIGRAVIAIHDRPGEPWSLDALAAVAGMSRSSFCARFAAVVGMSPARYLATWRMSLAKLWLRQERLTIAEIAARLGYESEASFSRAFKRIVGMPPSVTRHGAEPSGAPLGQPAPRAGLARPRAGAR